MIQNNPCLLYTSDAADERSSVDLGGRRIIKKKKITDIQVTRYINTRSKNITEKNNEKMIKNQLLLK